MKSAIYEYKSDPYCIQMQPILSNIPHFHKEIEMVYVSNGSVVAHADRNHCFLSSGDFFISFPNQIHYYEESIIGEYYVIILSPDIIFGLKSLFKNYFPENNYFPIESASKLEEYIIQSFKSLDSKYADPKIVGYMNLLMGEIIAGIKLKPRLQSDNSTLKTIMNFCLENYKDEITLDKVAQNLHLSKYYISKLLNHNVNLSFNDYINTLRINEACDLLTDTDKKIADISEDVGFGTIRSFNRSFLKIMNMTPIQYRESYKLKTATSDN